MPHAGSEGSLRYVGTPYRYLDGFRAALDPDAPAAFANTHGFARFAPDPGGRDAAPLAPSPEVSVGALSFYGFGTGAGVWYLQQLPIDVLAATLAVVAGGPVGAGDEDWTTSRLRTELAADVDEAGTGYRLGERLREACTELFSFHEYGHRLDPAVSPVTTGFLADRGLLEAGRFCDFPDEHQLGSWARLRAGGDHPDPADVLFLYGDLLANLAAIEAGLTAGGQRALRAYHWRFVGSDRPTGWPRGNIALLSTADDVIGRGLALVGDVLDSPPGRWAERMRRHEWDLWDELWRRPVPARAAGHQPAA